MSDSKRTIIHMPKVSTAQTGTSTLGDPKRPTSALDNLGVLWKIGLIAGILTLGMLILLLTSRSSLGVLSYYIDNIYNSKLIPISDLQEARINSIEAVRQLQVLLDPSVNSDAEQRKQVIEASAEYSGRVDVTLLRYKNEWISTKNPDFTSSLQEIQTFKYEDRNVKTADVIKKELNTFKIIDTLNQNMNKALAELSKSTRGSNAPQFEALIDGYSTMTSSLQDLIDANKQYAALSAAVANNAASRANLNTILWFAFSLLAGIALVAFVAQSITSRLSKLETSAQALREGDLNVRVDVSGRDEIGTVGNALNTSITQLRTLLKEQNLERERGIQLQKNVSEFLDVAMDISSGDLTKKGKVTEDVLGNVVDAINVMTDEFGYLLGNVREAANRVSLSAGSMTQTSQNILTNAQSQAELAKSAQAQTVRVSEAMNSLTEAASRGAGTAKDTLEASQVGQVAVTQTREQLENIRSEMLQMSQGMTNLARRSDEITDVVRTISRFASQTNLLALGASLEAAGAGAAGARFGAVANAVRSLADESAKAASRVTNLIKDVQTEISMLTEMAQDSAKQVQSGYSVATQAGDRLQRIAELANESAQVATSIANLAGEQAQSVQTVSRDVTQIAETAQVTESGTRQGEIAASELRTLSDSLTQSLTRFRLPS